jgi:tetratricopeptide (TPR) repeat protein
MGGPSTTLGSFAVASTQPPPRKRSRGVWLGVAAIVVVGGAVTAVMALGGHGPAAPPAHGDAGVSVAAAGDAGVVVATADAGQAAAPDAAQIAAVVVDAAVEPAADAPSGSGAKPRAKDALAGDAPPKDASAHDKSRKDATPNEAALAEKLNIEAKDAIYGEHYEVGVQKLRQAVALRPQPKYFVNLCVALLQLGRLDEALTACDAVDLYNPTSEHRRKAAQLIAKIRAEAKKNNLVLHAGLPRGDDKGEPPAPSPPDLQGQAPRTPTAQTEIARKFNEEGKALMYADKPDEAAKKFEQAAARVPDPTYVLNLCVASYQSGRFQDAMNACKGIEMYGPTTEQHARAAKMIDRIKAEARKQGIELQ